MLEQDAALARRRPRRSWPVALAGIVAMPVGLVLAMFGAIAWSLGPLALLVGFIAQRTGKAWAPWLIAIGLGLSAGTLAYIAIGLLTPDGPSSGSGTSP